ncbi:hypothetical protein QQ045_019710 [Rhodiola kirilowii]
MEKGIADESSVTAKGQLDVVKVRHVATVSNLQSAKEELENLRKRDFVLKKVEQDVTESKEVKKTVQDLIIELIRAKKLLEFAPVMHPQVEGNQLTTSIATEQRSTKLKEVEDEFKLFAEQVMSPRDLQSKLDVADVSLQELKVELSNYMDSKTTHGDDMRLSIEKAVKEVEPLKLVASSIPTELEREKAKVIELRFKNGKRMESQNVRVLGPRRILTIQEKTMESQVGDDVIQLHKHGPFKADEVIHLEENLGSSSFEVEETDVGAFRAPK